MPDENEHQGGDDLLSEKWRSTISHDLRAPVVTIDLAASLLRDEPAVAQSPELSGLIRRIAGAAGRLNDMIQNISDSMLIEAGRISIHLEEVDIRTIVEDAIEAISLPPGRPVEPRLEAAPERARVDPDRVERALEILLRNADQFGDPGTPIKIDVAEENGWVSFSVINEGPAPPDGSKLFERFYRARVAGRAAPEGLGLGLFVARGLIEAHGGRIGFERDERERTVFSFSVPAS